MSDSRFKINGSETEQELILPMPWPYVPTPGWCSACGLEGIVLIPIALACVFLVRTLMRIEPPPRARFTITPNQFKLEMVAQHNGERRTFCCDPLKIGELRKNRYEEGLWIEVPGLIKETFLEDVDRDTIQAICQELGRMLSKVAGMRVAEDSLGNTESLSGGS